jgi:ABC-2 type transport system ATP-binding protein
MTNLAIAAKELRTSHGDKVVLDGVDLAVPEGAIFALLGPNGDHTLVSPGRSA